MYIVNRVHKRYDKKGLLKKIPRVFSFFIFFYERIQNRSFFLSHVIILIGIVLVPFHVISVNKAFDPLFQIWWFHREFQLIVQLRQQQSVTQRFAHFHDANNGSVNLVLSILEHTLFSSFLFFVGFFQLNLINFDVEQLVGEFSVDFEFITVVDFFAFGTLE